LKKEEDTLKGEDTTFEKFLPLVVDVVWHPTSCCQTKRKKINQTKMKCAAVLLALVGSASAFAPVATNKVSLFALVWFDSI
jgi:hypothetical protein